MFAFVPVVAALPGWIQSELGNTVDRRDLVVLAFTPMRGAVALLDAFDAGVLPGGLAGIVAGLLLSAWMLTAGRPAPPRGRLLVAGAIAGATAAALVTAIVLARAFLTVPEVAVPTRAVLFELGSGLVCGLIAAPTAVRLLSEPARSDAPAGWTAS